MAECPTHSRKSTIGCKSCIFETKNDILTVRISQMRNILKTLVSSWKTHIVNDHHTMKCLVCDSVGWHQQHKPDCAIVKGRTIIDQPVPDVI